MGFTALNTLTIFVCFLVIFLSLYFKRSTPFILTFIFLLWQSFYILKFPIEVVKFHISLSIFIPFMFMIMAFFGEKGIYNKNALAKIFISICILFLSYFFAKSSYVIHALQMPIFSTSFYLLEPVSHVGLVIFSLALVILFIRFIFEKGFSFSLIVCMCFCYYPFLFSTLPFNTPIFLSLGVSVLGIMLIKDAYKMAFIDTLTQIPSRRALEEYLKGLGSEYILCMVDIDFFKKFNDTYGHKVGDEVLKYIAKYLKQTKKAKVFRYGGEEFTIIFTLKNLDEAIKYLEQTRQIIHEKGFYIRKARAKNNKNEIAKRKTITDAKKVILSVSMGVCQSLLVKTQSEAFSMADKALYKAKNSGRNCIKVHSKAKK